MRAAALCAVAAEEEKGVGGQKLFHPSVRPMPQRFAYRREIERGGWLEIGVTQARERG
jgi:hypothetical protein